MPQPDPQPGPQPEPPHNPQSDPNHLRRQLAARHLLQLRQQRVAPDRAAPIAPILDAQRREITKTARRIGPAGQAWKQICPPQFLHSTRVIALHHGNLRIAVDSAPARFAIDRWLRAGGRDQVIKNCKSAPIRRITLTTTPP